MFKDRQDAGRLLAGALKDMPLRDPLVLGIPRGGVEIAAAIAEGLHTEFDVVLARKLRSVFQPELAMGAIAENGEVFMDPGYGPLSPEDKEHLEQERRFQMKEIERRRNLFRSVRPLAPVAGRSVIVTDDGIATGSTMIASLQLLRAQGAHELIAAVPVAPADRLDAIRQRCDRLECLDAPRVFWAISRFYEQFPEVTDERCVELLRQSERQRESPPDGARPGTPVARAPARAKEPV